MYIIDKTISSFSFSLRSTKTLGVGNEKNFQGTRNMSEDFLPSQERRSIKQGFKV